MYHKDIDQRIFRVKHAYLSNIEIQKLVPHRRHPSYFLYFLSLLKSRSCLIFKSIEQFHLFCDSYKWNHTLRVLLWLVISLTVFFFKFMHIFIFYIILSNSCILIIPAFVYIAQVIYPCYC